MRDVETTARDEIVNLTLQLVEAGNVSVTVRNGSESVLLTATSVALLRTRPDRHESDWDRQVMWMIIIIVVTITGEAPSPTTSRRSRPVLCGCWSTN